MNENENNNQYNPHTSDYLAAGAGAGLAGGGAYLAMKGRKYQPSDAVSVSGGKLKPPLYDTDIGAGHSTPAQAIWEALSQHPDVQNGKYKLDKAPFIRTHEGTHQHPLNSQFKHHAAHIDTGFGVPFKGWNGQFVDPNFTVNPEGFMTFKPDPVPNNVAELQGGNWIHDTVPARYFSQLPLITYGPDARVGESIYPRVENFPDVHPALTDKVLQSAQQRLAQPIDKAQVLQGWAQKARLNGDEHMARLAEDALAKNKSILTISGSSRGDAVAQRAYDTYQRLKQLGLHDQVQIVALMGRNHHLDPELGAGGRMLQRMGLPIIQHPKMDQQDFLNAQDIADLHWGSTGASSFGESLLSSTPTGFSTNYTALRDAEIENVVKSELADIAHQQAMGKITPESAAAMKARLDSNIQEMRGIDLDSWNKGTMRWIKNMHQKGTPGIYEINTADDAIKRLNEARQLDKNLVRQRAAQNLEKSVAAKKSIANHVINHANTVNQRAWQQMMLHGIGGGAAMGAGALLTAPLLKKVIQRLVHRHREKKQAQGIPTNAN